MVIKKEILESMRAKPDPSVQTATISIINDHFKDDGWFGPMKVESKIEGPYYRIGRLAWSIAYRMHRMNRGMRVAVVFGSKPAYCSTNRNNFYWYGNSDVLYGSAYGPPPNLTIGQKLARSERNAKLKAVS